MVLFNGFWKNFYHEGGKYRPDYFKMYQCQVNFEIFCVATALGVSWQYLNSPSLRAHSVYHFHVYFYVQITLHHLGMSFSHEDAFSKVKNSYIKSAYYSIMMVMV